MVVVMVAVFLAAGMEVVMEKQREGRSVEILLILCSFYRKPDTCSTAACSSCCIYSVMMTMIVK